MQVAETLQEKYQNDLIRLRNLIIQIIETSNEPLNLSRINRILSTTYKMKISYSRVSGFIDGLYLNGDISILKVDKVTTIVSTPKKLGIYDTSLTTIEPKEEIIKTPEQFSNLKNRVNLFMGKLTKKVS